MWKFSEMFFIYNFFIKCYGFFIYIASFSNKKARLWIEGRKGLLEKIEENILNYKKVVVFHCSSLGEFEQARNLIEQFRVLYPDIKIMLTFFSPSGYEIRKNYKGADFIYYLPLDTAAAAERFVNIVKPLAFFIVKYEFWFNLINCLHKNKIPVFAVSAIFRPNHYFFKCYGRWAKKQLEKITYIFVQNEESEQLLIDNCINKISVSGDTRFDRVYAVLEANRDFPVVKLFASRKPVFIAGSTWQKDEQIIAVMYKKFKGKIKLIIAPHEVDSLHIRQIEELFPQQAIRLSLASEENINLYDILIIDSIGFLSHLYKYADIAYIGGGFGKGIHNILEAAVFSIPVLFGPNYHKFREAVDLIELGSAFKVSDSESLSQIVEKLIYDEEFRNEVSVISGEYVANNTGATAYILKNIEKYIEK